MKNELDAAVAAWRRGLAGRADLGSDDLDELEDHLREAVADLQARGLSAEEALLVAARRLGDADALGGRLATADPARRRGLRLRWLAMGGVVALVMLAFGALMVPLATFGPGLPDFEPPIFTSTRLVHLIIQLAFVAVGGLLAWRWLAGDRAARRIQDGGPAWILRVLAAVIFGGAALFFLFALLIRGGALSRVAPVLWDQPLPMVVMWLAPPLLLLLVPLALLLVVWRLTGRAKGG